MSSLYSKPSSSQCSGCFKARQRYVLRPHVCYRAQGLHRQHHAGLDRQVLAALGNEAGGVGDARQERPDACLDQDSPGPLTDLDVEWQAFLAGTGRRQQPQPLIWNGDIRQGPSGISSVCSSHGDGDAPTSSSCGPESSCSNRYASSIQSFDDWDGEDDFPVPVPCSVPVNEASARTAGSSSSLPSSLAGASTNNNSSSVGEQIWPPISSIHTRDTVSPADLLTSRSLWQSLGEVYVLLFGVGQKDTEGIYSLRAVSDDGLPTETIIAFENMDDAIRYAALLEATMEHSPHVCSIPPSELMAFCSDSGYRCRLELEGSLLMPPDYNVHITDWERSLRLREGKFCVLPEEPDFAAAAAGSLQPGAATGLQESSSNGQLLLRQNDFSAAQFTAAQLELLKAQLESLLPASPMQSQDE